MTPLGFLFVADNGPVVGCVGGFRGCRHPRKWRRRCWGEDDGARLNGGGGVVVGEDCGKFLSCCDAAGWHGGQDGYCCWTGDSCKKVICSGRDQVGGGGDGHAKLAGQPGDRVADAITLRVDHPTFVAAVGVECGSDVPAVAGVC